MAAKPWLYADDDYLPDHRHSEVQIVRVYARNPKNRAENPHRVPHEDMYADQLETENPCEEKPDVIEFNAKLGLPDGALMWMGKSFGTEDLVAVDNYFVVVYRTVAQNIKWETHGYVVVEHPWNAPIDDWRSQFNRTVETARQTFFYTAIKAFGHESDIIRHCFAFEVSEYNKMAKDPGEDMTIFRRTMRAKKPEQPGKSGQ
ncbi:MAG: hypothetical protein Q9171_007426 [Xanthocarpia ochracea]